MEKKWINYGDVNPIEHGGLWIMHDRGNTYRVVELYKVPKEVMENFHALADLYVDLDADWVDWPDVAACSDIDLDTCSDIDKVIALVQFYSNLEFGEQYFINSDNIIEELKKYDIEIKGEE